MKVLQECCSKGKTCMLPKTNFCLFKTVCPGPNIECEKGPKNQLMFRRRWLFIYLCLHSYLFLHSKFPLYLCLYQPITIALCGNTNKYADGNTNTNENTNTSVTIRRRQLAAGEREAKTRRAHTCTHLVIIMDTKG